MDRSIKFFIIIVSLIANALADTSSASYSTTSSNYLSNSSECARACVIGEKSKICYYRFVAEIYATLTGACDLCSTNATARLAANCECIQADGYELSGIKVVNRMYPGPSIMVCLNDYVVIDVENRLQGNGITIHWHGIFQNGYQYYDGVPYVTQCPITEGTSFRYQWRANNSGTHFWHSHSGLQSVSGLQGAIVVREPKETEINSQYWDNDDIDNVIFITDWFHDTADAHFPGNLDRNPDQLPDNYLINGMGQWTDPATGDTTTTPLAVFSVAEGRRYRFRMVNACSLRCPVQLTIQGHNMTVIATDGRFVMPVVVDSITSSSAERYDFVIASDKSPDSYWIQVRGLGSCQNRKTQQLGILQYESVKCIEPTVERPTYDVGLHSGIVLNQLNVRCDGSNASKNVVCITQLESASPVPEEILKEPDVRLFFNFGFYYYTSSEIFAPGTYRRFLGPDSVVTIVGKNITNVLPSSPLISQRLEIPDDQLCTLNDLPLRCAASPVCECSVVEKIPLNSIVELVLHDQDHMPAVSHAFHLHGGVFYIMNDEIVGKKSTRMSKNPPAKDTYAINSEGFTTIRFLANNPGYWLFHCHFLYHLTVGMSAIFHVGETSDLPNVPENFPVCGNFVPPIKND